MLFTAQTMGWLLVALVVGVAILIGLAYAILVALQQAAREAEATQVQSGRTCPHCASRIPFNAAVCRYCTRDVGRSAMAATPPMPAETTVLSDEDRRYFYNP